MLFGCAVAWIMGVRTPRAASFDDITFAGKGRATLVIEEVDAEPDGTEDGDEPRFGMFEVFARMTFGTEVSAFSHGLYMRSRFTLPSTGEAAVLVVDVDRANDRRRWKADERGLRARVYTVGAGSRFDGAPVSGSLELDAAIVGRRSAGFRISGWLEIVDAGPDGQLDSDDDTALEIEITLESLPTPEEIDGQPAPPPRQPQGGFCELPWCWADDGYYDGYSYGYGCGDAEVGYDTTSDGCEGDTIDNDPSPGGGIVDDGGSGSGGATDGFIDDGSTGAPGTGDVTSSDDSGCSGETTDSSSSSDSGCEGSDDGGSSDGCDGGDSGSSSDGCSDSSGGGCSDGGSGGCGSGCQGDTLQRADGNRRGTTRRAGVDLVGLGLLLASLGAWISNRRRR